MPTTVTRIALMVGCGGCFVVAACGGSKTGPGGSVDAHSGSGDASNIPTPDAPAGANTIMGSVGSGTFNTVGAVYWIGAPGSPGTDTVIYMFDRNIACGDITQAGWDTTIPAGTKILEMKMVGKTPMAYPTTTKASHVPAAGESLSSYTVAASTATDVITNGGQVTLSTIGQPANGQFASGTFNLTLPSGSLAGMYDAPFCPSGTEP